MKFTKLEQEYLVFMLLIKCVGFIELIKKSKFGKIDNHEMKNLINEFSLFYDVELTEENFVVSGKLIIKKYFPYFLEQLKAKKIDIEMSITEDILNQIDDCRKTEKINKYSDLQTLFDESENGKFYRIFFKLRYIIEQHNERNGIVAGETIYHSFARLSAEGVEEYFEYFKILCEEDVVNFENQDQENANFNSVPCIYWLLNSKEQLLYFNYLIKNKEIKMNHISSNEHGPSAFYFIIKDILNNEFLDRKSNKILPLDETYKNILFETLYNIVMSNYSVSYNKDDLYEVIINNLDNDIIKKIINYLTSEEGIRKQYENNKYPIHIGKKIDTKYNEKKLNSELDELIKNLQNLQNKKLIKK